jgi:hypothetical protein
MRCLIKVTAPTDVVNQAIIEGRFEQTLMQVLAELKPEAAYFTNEGGRRTAMIFADVRDGVHVNAISEPFFQAFNGAVEITPVLTPEDLQASAASRADAAKTYGRRQPAHA